MFVYKYIHAKIVVCIFMADLPLSVQILSYVGWPGNGKFFIKKLVKYEQRNYKNATFFTRIPAKPKYSVYHASMTFGCKRINTPPKIFQIVSAGLNMTNFSQQSYVRILGLWDGQVLTCWQRSHEPIPLCLALLAIRFGPRIGHSVPHQLCAIPHSRHISSELSNE